MDTKRRLERVTFTRNGIWVTPATGLPFWWQGSVDAFMAILVAHPELDIEGTQFFVDLV